MNMSLMFCAFGLKGQPGCPSHRYSRTRLPTAAMAMLPTFTAGFRGFFTVVGEVPARRLAAFFTGFGGFFAIIGKVARVFITPEFNT